MNPVVTVESVPQRPSSPPNLADVTGAVNLSHTTVLDIKQRWN